MRNERYTNYFQALLDEMRVRHHFARVYRPGQGKPYYAFASGPGIKYVAGFNRAHTVYTELLINFGDYEKNKTFFDTLKERESEINAEFKVPLYWDRRDEIKSSYIYIDRDGTIESDENELEAFRAWHIENLLKFKKVFTPEIQTALDKLKSSEF